MTSKLKHTPGPWKLTSPEKLQEYILYRPLVWSSKGEGHGAICEMKFFDQFDEANARLIAAAPEMIEALILVYKTTALTVDIAMEIQDIIERATGLSIAEVLSE